MELNIYGVNKTATDMWVKVVTPLELAPIAEALVMSQTDAMAAATNVE